MPQLSHLQKGINLLHELDRNPDCSLFQEANIDKENVTFADIESYYARYVQGEDYSHLREDDIVLYDVLVRFDAYCQETFG